MSDEATVERDTQIAIRVYPVANMDAYDVWIFRYHWPVGEPAWAEVLTGDGWVRRDETAEMATSTLQINGFTLHYDKPLDIALRGLVNAERDWRERVETFVEGAVMRALAGTPAWFPLYQTSDDRLLVDVTDRDV